MRFRDFLAREWNSLLAIGALFSLAFIYPYLPTASSESDKQMAELNNIESYVIGKEYEKAGKYLIHFIDRYPDSSFIGESHFLFGKTLLGIAKSGEFSVQVLGDAVSNLQESLDFAIKNIKKELKSDEATFNLIKMVSEKLNKRVDDEKIKTDTKVTDETHQSVKSFIEGRKILYEVALLLRDNGILDRSREILKMPYFRDVKSALLDIAISYGMEPAPIKGVDEKGKSVVFEEYYVDEYKKAVPEGEKINGYMAEAVILYLRKNYVKAYETLAGMEALTKDQAKLMPILLEKGRVLLKLNELDKAIEVLNIVQKKAVETDISNSAIFYLAEAYIRKNVPLADGLLTSGLINNNSSLASVGELSLGRFRYENKRSDFIQNFKDGFELARNLAIITKYEVDINEIANIIRSGWEAEGVIEELKYYEPTYLALKKLYGVGKVSSANLRYLHRWVRDLADLYRKVANMYKAESDKNLTERDFQKATDNIGKANECFNKAASEYIEITRLESASTNEQASAYKDAADALFAAKRFDEAADKYGISAGIMTRPASQFGRLKQAQSLRLAGKFNDAVKTFGVCIKEYGNLDKYTKSAIVEKARTQIDMGSYSDAIETLKMLLEDEGGVYGVTPLDEEWEKALYFSGMAYFELSKSQLAKGNKENKVELMKDSSTQLINARKKFLEFLNRYALNLDNGQKIYPLSLNAAYYVAISYTIEHNWGDTLYYFNKVVDFSREIEGALEPEQKDLLKRAYFYIGDMYFNLNKFPEARKAYETAYKRYIVDKEKLWGLIGVAKCYLKMDKIDEASLWCENAALTFENFKTAYENAPKDFGANFWMKQLGDLKEDIKRRKAG